jgi:hypothetical protein
MPWVLLTDGRPRLRVQYLCGRMSGRDTSGGGQAQRRDVRWGLYQKQQHLYRIPIKAFCSSRCKLSHKPLICGSHCIIGARLRGLRRLRVEAHRSSRDRSSFVPLRRQGSVPKAKPRPFFILPTSTTYIQHQIIKSSK